MAMMCSELLGSTGDFSVANKEPFVGVKVPVIPLESLFSNLALLLGDLGL